MENLETLTDQQLKTKLMEFGFANLPITDTTRKVLMKKLKNAMETQKVKSRRETIAVTKFSSDEEVEPASKARPKTPLNRRATIAATETKKTNGIVPMTNGGRAETPSKSKTTPARRASRTTPAKQIQEDSDEDDLPLISQVVTRRSASRTVTPTILGMSEVVRTTYKRVEPVDEETEIQFEEIAEPVETKTTRRKTITTSSSSNIQADRSTPTNFRRTTITTSYNPSGTTNIDKNDEDLVVINEATTPYLSSFAKRLSTLKAEPLDIGMQKYRSETTTSTSQYPRSSVAATSSGSSHSYRKPQGGIMRDLTKTFDSLEKRYRFRTTLYVVASVLIIIAIYVLFFT